MIYLDASALVKLLVHESESDALAAFLSRSGQWVTSRIAAVEVPRAVKRAGASRGDFATMWGSVGFLELDDEVARRAVAIEPVSMRTLDAIHLASALVIGPELNVFVTYDHRMAETARVLGLPLEAPA